MTDHSAGDKAPHTTGQHSTSDQPLSAPATVSSAKVRVSSPVGLVAVIPHLLGFHPARSLVIVGLDRPQGRVTVGFRFDLPDPPDPARARDIAEHVIAILEQRRIRTVVAVGYGEAALVNPVAEAVQAALRGRPVVLRDLLRVDGGRYWSYTCQNPTCCPPGGAALTGLREDTSAAALEAAGMTVHPDRASLAAMLAPVTGAHAQAMRKAQERTIRRTQQLTPGWSASRRTRFLLDTGRTAVREAISLYRSGGKITDHDQMAWLLLAIADIRVRDDAWAQMEPEYRAAHLRMWTDVLRHADEPHVPAAATLLAFTAWQCGEGALANIAIERALAAGPKYSMAILIGQALEAGLPPEAAQLPMTSKEVEASYAASERDAPTASEMSGERDTAAGERDLVSPSDEETQPPALRPARRRRPRPRRAATDH